MISFIPFITIASSCIAIIALSIVLGIMGTNYKIYRQYGKENCYLFNCLPGEQTRNGRTKYSVYCSYEHDNFIQYGVRAAYTYNSYNRDVRLAELNNSTQTCYVSSNDIISSIPYSMAEYKKIIIALSATLAVCVLIIILTCTYCMRHPKINIAGVAL
jgi:hypothetical protein